MDRKQYKQYITDKYKDATDITFTRFSKIDSMLSFVHLIKSKNIIFKGALNLFDNFGYSREKLTKDADFSINEITFEEAIKEFKMISNKEGDIYTYEILDKKELKIATSGYEGIQLYIGVMFTFSDKVYYDKFSIDIAVEEIYSLEGITKKKDILIYTIERTLADKFVSTFHHEHSRGREKDYVDILALYESCDKEQFYSLSKTLITHRSINKNIIDKYVEEYKEHKYVVKYDLSNIFEEILKNLF